GSDGPTMINAKSTSAEICSNAVAHRRRVDRGRSWQYANATADLQQRRRLRANSDRINAVSTGSAATTIAANTRLKTTRMRLPSFFGHCPGRRGLFDQQNFRRAPAAGRQSTRENPALSKSE